MAEPATAITDFLMAAVALVLAARLAGAWRWAFVFTAIAALAGGFYHTAHSVVIWKITVFSVGLATFFLIVAARRAWIVFAAVELFAYIAWMSVHDEFIYVIADYGSGLVILAVVYIQSFRTTPRESKLVLSSIAVAAVGAAVQASGMPWHNDIYHLIQIASLVLLYLGVRRPAAALAER